MPSSDGASSKRPTLIVVSGPPGSGKTTLAHEIARAIPCPAICRDEIKEGLVHTEGDHVPTFGGPISKRTHETFFDVLRLLLTAGVTFVAEAAFQDKLWRPDLEPMSEVADLRIVHCAVHPDVARERISRRAAADPMRVVSHADQLLLEALDSGDLSLASFDPISLAAPCVRVDTTDGYDPSLDEVVAFATGRV